MVCHILPGKENELVHEISEPRFYALLRDAQKRGRTVLDHCQLSFSIPKMQHRNDRRLSTPALVCR